MDITSGSDFGQPMPRWTQSSFTGKENKKAFAQNTSFVWGSIACTAPGRNGGVGGGVGGLT